MTESAHLPEEDVYYIITCYLKEEFSDKYSYKDHRSPSYLSNYDMDINKPLVIQAGIYDAIKFDNTLTPTLYMQKAEETFEEYEFELSMVSKNIFGRGIARFVHTL